MHCIACGCTEDRACPGGCSWVTVNPPKCSACFDIDGMPYAVGDFEGGLFGDERCPASMTPAPCMPFWTSTARGHCVRCKQTVFASEAA